MLSTPRASAPMPTNAMPASTAHIQTMPRSPTPLVASTSQMPWIIALTMRMAEIAIARRHSPRWGQETGLGTTRPCAELPVRTGWHAGLGGAKGAQP